MLIEYVIVMFLYGSSTGVIPSYVFPSLEACEVIKEMTVVVAKNNGDHLAQAFCSAQEKKHIT